MILTFLRGLGQEALDGAGAGELGSVGQNQSRGLLDAEGLGKIPSMRAESQVTSFAS